MLLERWWTSISSWWHSDPVREEIELQRQSAVEQKQEIRGEIREGVAHRAELDAELKEKMIEQVDGTLNSLGRAENSLTEAKAELARRKMYLERQSAILRRKAQRTRGENGG